MGKDRSSRKRGPQTPQDSAPQQAGAVPFRWEGGKLQICLITTRRNRHKWIIPKGLIERGDTPTQTALKEAEEEAGLVGRLMPEPLGQYQYKKLGRWLSVQVYAMEVHASHESWAEEKRRRRRWVEAQQAIEMVSAAQLKPIVMAALNRIMALPSPQAEG